MSKFRAFLPALLYYILISVLSSQSRVRLPIDFPLIDKVLHFILYTGFGVCLAWGYLRTAPRGACKGPGFVLALGAFLSGLDEVHQFFVPGRSADVMDALVDVLGILAGWGLVLLARRLRAARSRRRKEPRSAAVRQP